MSKVVERCGWVWRWAAEMLVGAWLQGLWVGPGRGWEVE